MAGERPPDAPDRTPTGAELTALDPKFRTDPHPVLARLRRDEPAHYDRVINRWILTRHDDVERVLRDRTMSLDPHKANEGTYMRLFLPLPGQAANMSSATPPTTPGSARWSTRRSPRAPSSAWRHAFAGSSAICSTPWPRPRTSISSRRSPGRCR